MGVGRSIKTVWYRLRVVVTLACIAAVALLATTAVMMLFNLPVQLLYMLIE